VTISKQELADGIRFAGQRVATAARYTKNWDHQLAHQWTSRDAFCHIASTSGGLPMLQPMMAGGQLNGVKVDQVAQINAQNISNLVDKSQDEIVQAILDGQEASAKYVEGMDESALSQEIKLGEYEMPVADLIAQIWINHQLGHAYEASARWPLA
jgi:hypothetical protein